MKYLTHIYNKIKSALTEQISYQQGGSASMAVSTIVGTAKKLCNLVFLSLQQSKKQIDEAISKEVNVMEILYFYENLFLPILGVF